MCTALEGATTTYSQSVIPGYEKLAVVFQKALHQMQEGKGKERHAEDNKPLDEQTSMIIEKLDVGFARGQAIKKIVESKRLDKNDSIKELLGAINYIALKIIEIKNGEAKPEIITSK